jgi:hypothetical protein
LGMLVLRASVASVITEASTQPPETDPITSPSSLRSRAAPGSCGADLSVGDGNLLAGRDPALHLL